jgi:hypothetical protein
MKVMTLFDASGTIHALFQSSTHSEAPVLRFQPAPGWWVFLKSTRTPAHENWADPQRSPGGPQPGVTASGVPLRGFVRVATRVLAYPNAGTRLALSQRFSRRPGRAQKAFLGDSGEPRCGDLSPIPSKFE